MLKTVKRSSPVKRKKKRIRRTKAVIEAIKDAIVDILDKEHPLTIRQIYYILVSKGLIKKTQGHYDKTIDMLGELRYLGAVPYEWIIDTSRQRIEPNVFDSVKDILTVAANSYRRSLWTDNPERVEIWCESRSIAVILEPITQKYGVHLCPAGGNASISFAYEGGKIIEAAKKPTFLYYFGDHDEAGLQIPKDIKKKLEEHAGDDAEIHFKIEGITYKQIKALKLDARLSKTGDGQSTDYFQDDNGNMLPCVEFEALDPSMIRALVKLCILRHLDSSEIKRIEALEQKEREQLKAIASKFKA